MPGNEKVVFQGKMIEIIHETGLINGKEVIFERGRRAPGVRMIIETPDGQILIGKENRRVLGIDYRLPGGKVFDSLDEYNSFLREKNAREKILDKAKEAVIKEAREEVGILPKDFDLFHISLSGGSFEWDLYYFIVKVHEETTQSLEEGEEIEIMKISKDKLRDLALSGEMKEERSIAVVFKYLYNR